LGTATQSCKITDPGQWILRRRGLSAESIQTSCGLQSSSKTVCRKLNGMGFHGRAAASKPYIIKCNAKRQMQLYKAHCYWTGVMKYTSPPGISMYESGFGGLPGEQYFFDCIVPSVNFGGERITVSGCFKSWALPFISRERNSECLIIPRHIGQFKCSQICGNSLEMACSCSNTTAHQCTKQDP